MIRRSFDENGDYAINHFIEGTPATAQAVTTRLRLFKGEWFLNLNSGVPWFQEVFVKPARLAQTDSMIRKVILQTEGVAKLLKFELTFERDRYGTGRAGKAFNCRVDSSELGCCFEGFNNAGQAGVGFSQRPVDHCLDELH